MICVKRRNEMTLMQYHHRAPWLSAVNLLLQ